MAANHYTAPDRERRRKMLRTLLQQAGAAQSTEELHDEMQKAFGGYSIRTTRRDLEALAAGPQFAKSVKGPDRKRRYWISGRGSIDLTLTPAESMTLTAIFQHADRFGFRIESEELSRLREYAKSEVWATSTRNLVAEGRITSGTRFMVLQPGDYKPEHLTTIQEAMIGNASLEVIYRPRDAAGVDTCLYLLKPLALSYQDSNIYLSAFVAEEKWPEGFEPPSGAPRGKFSSNGSGRTCVLMLHRMVDVRSHWQQIPEPAGYDVSAMDVQKDLMTIYGDEVIDLELCLSANLHNRLSENPLALDQIMVSQGKQWNLKCRMHDSQGLRLFLLSNASDIQVLAPAYLREHVRGVLSDALEKYRFSQD